jgi:hypothetical protein
MATTEALSVSLDNAELLMHNRIEIRKVSLDTVTAALVTFPLGSSWVEDSQPFRGTHSCPLPHVGYMIEGAMGVRMDDGSAAVFEQGDVFLLPPGHDAWPEHDAPCTFVEFSQGSDYYDEIVASYEPRLLE